jgi:hypothetical protein
LYSFSLHGVTPHRRLRPNAGDVLVTEKQFDVHKHINSEDRLMILQSADAERKWTSLDDQRLCVICQRVVRGRQIDITRDQRGRYTLRCPTDGCTSTAHDWIYPRRLHSSDRHGLDADGAAEFSFFNNGNSPHRNGIGSA